MKTRPTMSGRFVLNRILASLSLLLAATTGHAITAIEALIDPPQGFTNKLDLSLQGKSGNTDTKDHEVGFISHFRKDQHLYLFLADYGWGESRGKRDEENGSIHVRSIWLNGLKTNWDTELFAQWGFDQFKDLSDRSLLGGGVRHHLSKASTKGNLNGILGVGGFYEDEKRKLTTQSKDTTRLNLYVNWEYDRSKGRYPSVLFTSFYVQPSVEDAKDVRSIATAGLKVPLSDNLSLKLTIDADYNSQPFGDVEKTDTRYKTSVSYKF